MYWIRFVSSFPEMVSERFGKGELLQSLAVVLCLYFIFVCVYGGIKKENLRRQILLLSSLLS